MGDCILCLDPRATVLDRALVQAESHDFVELPAAAASPALRVRGLFILLPMYSSGCCVRLLEKVWRRSEEQRCGGDGWLAFVEATTFFQCAPDRHPCRSEVWLLSQAPFLSHHDSHVWRPASSW